MHRSKARPILVLLLFFIVHSYLFCGELPPLDLVAKNTQFPILLIESPSNIIVWANDATSRFLNTSEDQLVGNSLPMVLGLDTDDLLSLQGKTVPVKSDTGTFRSVTFGIQMMEHDGQYGAVMLQDRTAQERLVVRNRILIISLVTLLLVAVLFLVLFLFLQIKLMRQVQQQRKQQDFLIQLLQRFLDADSRISYIKDAQGKFIFVNAALAAFLGTEPAILLDKSMEEFAPEKLARAAHAYDATVLGDQTRIDYEFEWDKHIYQVTKFPLTLPDGKPGLGTFAIDISEPKRQEESLKKSLKRSAMLVEILSSSFTNVQEQLETALQRACELTESSSALLLLWDADTQRIRIRAQSSGDAQPLPSLTAGQSLSDDVSALFAQLSPTQAVRESFNTLLLSELFGVKDPKDRKNTLIIPFWMENNPVGVVVFFRTEAGFEQVDTYQVQLLFSGVHTSIQKARKEAELAASQESLRLILDSTAEGIYGIDQDGLCTFCNSSCLSLLGYEKETDLLGKNLHMLCHYSTREGVPIAEKDCPIQQTLRTGEGVVMENDVFFKQDGSCFDVLCYSYPQIKNGVVIGAVVTFTNNTERKAALKKIQYLSYHDQLTGLSNRAYFDEALHYLNTEEHLPISIIVGDVNGLKLTNDIFGHTAGDTLLTNIANTLSQACRKTDIISRIGGDEFVIILPSADTTTVERILQRINHRLDQSDILAGSRSIALGSATKITMEESIHTVFDLAEERMYRRKTLRRSDTQHQQLQVLTHMLFNKAPEEEEHAVQVQQSAAMLARILHLSSEDAGLLTRAARYHDIGKVVLDTKVITTKNRDAAMMSAYQEHVSSGYRILNTFEETLDLAPLVLNHHERWDGKGFLKGLSKEEIPYLARILRLAEVWVREQLDSQSKEERRSVLESLSATELDPALVEEVLQSS
ncbi:diguanylate cyclase [Sphaerochaeta sp.]|uniref:diguanylate cyclase n=2 Tax=Sphaerochaeta sp. TaxID=1972642 RepID=UPI002FCC463A